MQAEIQFPQASLTQDRAVAHPHMRKSLKAVAVHAARPPHECTVPLFGLVVQKLHAPSSGALLHCTANENKANKVYGLSTQGLLGCLKS